MTRDDIKTLLTIVLSIALIVVAVRFFFYMLPVIVLLLVGLLLYDSYKNKTFIWKDKGTDKKSKKDNIKEAEVISEKKNK